MTRETLEWTCTAREAVELAGILTFTKACNHLFFLNAKIKCYLGSVSGDFELSLKSVVLNPIQCGLWKMRQGKKIKALNSLSSYNLFCAFMR